MSPDARRDPVPRMRADDRRELVLEAATLAFARTGYAGTSTDVVAREAGVSQPYVVRMFGTKRELFLSVFARSCDRICATFRDVLTGYSAERPFDPEDEADWAELGSAYARLVDDRALLLVLLHGFAAGEDPAIGAQARAGMAEIFGVLVDTGSTPERAMAFVAHGMLLNVMLAMRAPEHLDEVGRLADLTRCAFGEDGTAVRT